MFGVGARLLGRSAEEGEAAGALWSLVDGAHHCSDPQSRAMLRRRGAALLEAGIKLMPRVLRPLTVLAALAAADLLREGSGLGRLSAALRHRLFGSLPRS
jgi:hypothetical protein